MNPLFAGEPVTLSQVLASREARAARQKQLLSEHPGASVVCLLVNIPGAVKRSEAAKRAFEAGVSAVNGMIAQNEWTVFEALRLDIATGYEGYWAVACEPAALKRRTVQLEEQEPLGRLWDIDVIGQDGVPLSRGALGFAPRCCFVCGQPAAGCASRARHAAAELEQAIRSILQNS